MKFDGHWGDSATWQIYLLKTLCSGQIGAFFRQKKNRKPMVCTDCWYILHWLWVRMAPSLAPTVNNYYDQNIWTGDADGLALMALCLLLLVSYWNHSKQWHQSDHWTVIKWQQKRKEFNKKKWNRQNENTTKQIKRTDAENTVARHLGQSIRLPDCGNVRWAKWTKCKQGKIRDRLG